MTMRTVWVGKSRAWPGAAHSVAATKAKTAMLRRKGPEARIMDASMPRPSSLPDLTREYSVWRKRAANSWHHRNHDSSCMPNFQLDLFLGTSLDSAARHRNVRRFRHEHADVTGRNVHGTGQMGAPPLRVELVTAMPSAEILGALI
jgi:hypothetical protein